MPESSSTSGTPIKRACDGCHRRKVKCIPDSSSNACKNCQSSNLKCTYDAIPQKKGPKGSRAKIILELKETQRQAQSKRPIYDMSPMSPTYTRTPGLLSMELITTCLDYFFANLYPTQPILHRQRIMETVGIMEHDIEAYCLVVSLCAYMLIQPNIEAQEVVTPGLHTDATGQPQPALLVGPTLLREAIRCRKMLDYNENPSINSIITSFFLFGSYFCLDKQNTAWFHLREATTLAHLMGLHRDELYRTPDIIENTRRRRLYWLLFITERAYALQQHRPLTLHATISLPTVDEDPSETVQLNGFIHLVNLFKPFDDTFVGLWNKSRTGATPEFFSHLQQQLSEALPTYLQSVESQAVDLRCSQQWLRTMVWQLSISHGFLSSTATENAMGFHFPIEVSRDLVAATSNFSRQSMEVHGIGLIEKLFDVACTLTDVISCVPTAQPNMQYGPRDYLQQLITLISTLRGGQQKYLPLLASKVNDTLAHAPAYSLSLAPASASSGTSEMYEGTESSRRSTPFGSPALGSEGSLPHAFGTMMTVQSPVTSSLAGMALTTQATAPRLAMSSQQLGYNDYFHQSGEPMMKYESDG